MKTRPWLRLLAVTVVPLALQVALVVPSGAGGVASKMSPAGRPVSGNDVPNRAGHVAVGTGPHSPVLPDLASQTAQADGSGSIVAPGDTSVTRPAPRGGARADSFSGSCQLSGSVAFQPALTNSPQAVDQRAQATGVCTGDFTGADGHQHHLADAPVSYLAFEQANGSSCTAGTDAGSGRLVFPYGTIRFAISEVRAGPVVTAAANGTRGGSAAGQGNVSPSENPAAVLQACAGSGLAGAPIDIRLVTAPSISG